MAFSASAGMNLCLGRGTLDSDMYMKAGKFGQVAGDVYRNRQKVRSICRWVCAKSMLIRGLFPDLHLIFCGGETQIEKPPARSKPGVGLSVGYSPAGRSEPVSPG
jgi:hypothetical protein